MFFKKKKTEAEAGDGYEDEPSFSFKSSLDAEEQAMLNNTNSIRIILDSQGTPYLKVELNNVGSEAGKHLGDAIFAFTHGLYSNTLLNTLIDLGKEDRNHETVAETLVEWNRLEEAEPMAGSRKSSGPVVRPTSFMKGIKSNV